jgi:N-methylhydantoinase B
MKGDVVTLAVGGGGGYGRAGDRAPHRIDDDFADGIISGDVTRQWKLVS